MNGVETGGLSSVTSVLLGAGMHPDYWSQDYSTHEPQQLLMPSLVLSHQKR